MGKKTVAFLLRARAKITSPVWASIHPVWLRCSSFPYGEYAQSSRLARQVSQHPNRGSDSCANPCQFPPRPHPNTIVLKDIRQEAEISSCSHPKNRIGCFSNHTIRRQLVVSTTNLGRSHETPNTQKQRCALFNIKEDTMNPLDSIPGTIASGFVLTVVLYFVVKMLV